VPSSVPFADAIAKLEFALITQHIAKLAVSLYGHERIDTLAPSPVYAEVADEMTRMREMTALLAAEDIPPFIALDECRPALHRAGIAQSIVTAEDYRIIAAALALFRETQVFFRKRVERAPLLAGMADAFHVDKLLEHHIDRIVDEEGNVKDGASKDLRRLRTEIIEKSTQLRRRMESILKRVSEEQVIQEELVTLRDGRLVLPVKAEYKRQVPGYIHSSSATGQTVYIEPTETIELNNDIRDLQFEEQREIARILTELTDRLRPHVPDILASLGIYADLDSLYARARYAAAVLAGIPDVKVSGSLSIQQGRHPILLLRRRMRDVVPLDLELGDPSTTFIITGPNAGGKSVAMKTVGLFSLMVQSGIPVPCDEASSFPVYSNIFVDIGDEQSVENDLSTFSSHVQRLAAIIRHADARSLVLIDEIGTGTDPSEGSALGAAILETLTERKAHVIATTHHGMLKAFAHEHPRMENAAMEFDLATLQPTYRFRAGLPGSSYAFEITRRHGMEPGIIDRAKALLGNQSDAFEHLLAEVEKQSQALGTQVREAEQKRIAYEARLHEYEQKMAALKAETKALRQQALEEADEILAKANALVENTIREIRESQAARETIKTVKDRLAESKETVRAQLDRPTTSTQSSPQQREERFLPGDLVIVQGAPENVGTVVDIPKDGSVAVAFGHLKMRVETARLLRHVAAKPKETVSAHMTESVPKSEIDLRGMYGDEAIKTLDQYLYEAYNAGFKRVDIIHGKGTGALRKRVQEYLKDLRIVDRFRLGEWNEGTTGVTVCFFKET
jgi:DNA mismatch repair protein MutS2